MRHVRATGRSNPIPKQDATNSDDEEQQIGNEHLKDNVPASASHWVDDLFPDGSIDAWTLVAKELLTV